MPATHRSRLLPSLGLVLFGACNADAPDGAPVERPRLAGWRFVFVSDDGALHRVYDRDHLPRAEGSACSRQGCRVEVAKLDPPSTSERLGDTDPGPTLWTSRAIIEATAPAAAGVTWTTTVSLTVPPETLERVRAIRDLREAGEHQKGVERALEERRHAGPWQALWIDRERSRCEASLGHPTAAAETMLASADVADALKLMSEVANRRLAASYWFLFDGRLDRALEAVEGARRAAHELSDPILTAKASLYRGHVEFRMGQLLRAHRLYEDAFRGLASSSFSDRASVAHSFALVESVLGDHYHALELLAGVLEDDRFETLGPDARSTLLGIRAFVMLSAHTSGHTNFAEDSMLDLLRRSVEILRAADLPRSLHLAMVDLAAAHLSLGHPREALQVIESLPVLPEEVESFESATLRQLRGEVALALGEPEHAEAMFRHALREALRLSGGEATEWTWRARHGLARVLASRGATKRAATAFLNALQDRRGAAARTSLQEGRATFLADRSRVITDAIAFFLSQGRSLQALAVAEGERAALVAGLDTEARGSRLSEAQTRELAQRIGAYQRLRARYERVRQETRSLEGEARRKSIRSLREIAEQKARAFESIYAHLDEAAPIATFDAENISLVQARLRPDEAVLSSLPMKDSRDGAVWLTRSAVETSTIDADFFDPIIGLERLRGVRHLYVVPGRNRELESIHTGPLRPDRGPPVSVSYLPFAAMIARKLPDLDGPAVVVADPEGDLPHARREADAVRHSLAEPIILTGADASRSAVVRSLGAASLFHFSGHGELSPASPWQARLRLADGERLTLEDVLVTRPRAKLVVLNGCETGVEMKLSRTFALGMPEAFLVAGARSILATDAPVRDEDALEFVNLFYEHGGYEEPAEALRRASLAAMARDLDVWKHYRVIGQRDAIE